MQTQFLSATAQNTPAQILYQIWADALEGFYGSYAAHRSNRSMYYGTMTYGGIGYDGTDANGKPIIGFGHLISFGRRPSAKIRITADGEFQLGLMYRWRDRLAVAEHTFLGWGYAFSRHQWYYRPSKMLLGNAQSGEDLKDRTKHKFYLPEKILALHEWNARREEMPWWKLEQDPNDHDGWKIVFVRDVPGPSFTGTTITQSLVDSQTALAERRYKRMETAHLIDIGLINPKTRRPFKTEDELKKERREAVQILSSHFMVTRPAVTKPLKKHEEEGLWPPNGCP